MSVAEIVCESRVASVVVHARGALVSRIVTLPSDLPREAVDLVVSGVTTMASVGGSRVEIDGDRSVIGLRARRIIPPGNVARGGVADRILAAERAFWKLDEGRKASVRERDRLMAVVLDTDLARRTRRVDPAARIADALAASQLVREQLEKVDDAIRAFDEAMETNTRERNALALEGSQARPLDIELASSRRSLEFVLRLARSEHALRSLTLTYAVDAARWWPAYTARFSQNGSRVAWALEALIAQDSGEEWTDVSLSLSTADLIHDARLPELPSLRLGRAQPTAKRGFRPPPAGLEQLFAGYDRVRIASSETPPPVAKRSTRAAGLEADAGMVALESRAETLVPHSPDRAKRAMASPPPPPPPSPSAPGATPMSYSAGMTALPMQSAPSMPRGGFAVGGMGGGGASSETAEQSVSFGVADAPSGPDESWLDFDTLTLGAVDDHASRGRLVRGNDVGDPAMRQRAVHAIEALPTPRDAIDPSESRGHFDHQYEASARCDVASNARVQRVTLQGVEAEAETRFRTVPREQNDVFREAVLRNPFDVPLLSGPVDVFVDDALLAQSRITFIDRGGTLRLGLGVEERVRVARNARVDESTAGLLGGSTAIDHVVSIDLSSSLGRAVRVEVVDRLPVTDDKDIEVALTASQPRAENYDQADLGVPVRGGLRFRVDVPPGGRAHVEFAYRVKLPAKSEVVGGNRRE